jgi:hypothetical protein
MEANNATNYIPKSFNRLWMALRQTLFTRENLWVIIVAGMILLIVTLGTMGVQPRFVYSGF